jgi:hypothetical protein
MRVAACSRVSLGVALTGGLVMRSATVLADTGNGRRKLDVPSWAGSMGAIIVLQLYIVNIDCINVLCGDDA